MKNLNLKSIRDAAEFSKENNKMFEHTPRRLFHELMSEDLTIKLLDYIADLEKCVELQGNLLNDILKNHECGFIIDTSIGKTLTTVEGILKKYDE